MALSERSAGGPAATINNLAHWGSIKYPQHRRRQVSTPLARVMVDVDRLPTDKVKVQRHLTPELS